MSDFSKFQIMVYDWACNCFSSNIVENKNERNDRFLEEALELVQSLECWFIHKPKIKITAPENPS